MLFGYTYSEGPSAIGKRILVVTLNGNGLQTEPQFEDFAVWNFDEESPNNPFDIAEKPNKSIYAGDIFQN